MHFLSTPDISLSLPAKTLLNHAPVIQPQCNRIKILEFVVLSYLLNEFYSIK